MQFIKIENKAARVTLDEVVHKESMDRVKEEIGQVFGASAFESGTVTGEITNCIENAADTLQIDIHSPGGSVIDGYTLYNEILELRERGVYVTARITLAASMASVIAMAADEVVIKRGGRMMIHEASTGSHGDADTLRNAADLLESISDEIAGIYAERTGLPRNDVRKMMKKETWLNADEAIEKGFADSQFDTPKKSKAMNILDKLSNPSSEEAREKIAALENAAEAFDSQIEEFKNKAEQAEGALQEAATELEAVNASKIAAEILNAELETKVADLEAKVESLTVEAESKAEEVESKIEELKEAASETEGKVEAKAAELLAAVGHPEPVDINDEGDQPQDTFAEYRKLQATDPRAATKFWNEQIAPNLK